MFSLSRDMKAGISIKSSTSFNKHSMFLYSEKIFFQKVEDTSDTRYLVNLCFQ